MRSVDGSRWGLAAAVAAAVVLTGCSNGGPAGLDGSRDAYDALLALGARCVEPTVTQPRDLPYLQIACGDLQVDWIDDDEAYADLWRADCAAVSPAGRTSLAAVSVVVGDGWLLRTIASDDGWETPRLPTLQGAADRFDGRLLTGAQYCEDLGAWS